MLVQGTVNGFGNKRRTSCHDNGARDHQFPVATLERAQEPEHNDSTDKDAESNWQSSDTHSYGIMTVDIKSLCGPEK